MSLLAVWHELDAKSEAHIFHQMSRFERWAEYIPCH